MNNKENKLLNQDLKNQLVELVVKDKNENGVSKIKTFINIYLKEYEKTKFNKEMLKTLFNKPSKEKILIELVSIE
mgnify:CR=1 FL=1